MAKALIVMSWWITKGFLLVSIYPLGSVERTRILNVYKAEALGHAVDQGTPNMTTPVGKPCN